MMDNIGAQVRLEKAHLFCVYGAGKMQIEPLYKIVMNGQEVDALIEIMIAAVDAELIDGNELALATAILNAFSGADEDEPEDEPQVMLN